MDSPAALGEKLERWRRHERVALDTEFVRERTYFPQLALVQLAVPGEVLLVDPLVPGMATALVPLLEDAGTTKLMHSASEDLQALMRGCGALPAPLFDTQVAAAMCGYGAGLGYLRLVEQVAGVTLEKGETRSDWLRRPLSESQLKYAADDVLYLHQIHDVLSGKLQAMGRMDWLAADCARAVGNARDDGDDPWPHLALRSAQTLDAAGQARLCRLLRWRDVEARRSDRPKGWILDNELAVLLSRRPPEDIHRFNALLDGHPKAPRKSRRDIWALLEKPLDAGELALPLAASGDTLDKNRLRRLQDAVAGLARELDLPEGLLCSRRHLESLLEGRPWPQALEGWRRDRLEPILSPLLSA